MKLTYYRNRERISDKTLNEIKKFFTLTNYNWIEEVEVNDEFDCHPDLESLFFAIQCNEHLNGRSQALHERIAKTKKPTPKGEYPKGYTDSKSGGWYCVEQHLMHQLVQDANVQLSKDGESQVNTYERMGDFYRYYDMVDVWEWDCSPLHKDLRDARRNTADIPRPEKFYDFVDVFTGTKQCGSRDQCSTYKLYYIAIKGSSYNLFREDVNNIYNACPYLGKLLVVKDNGEAEYLQLYVYDYVNRNWSVNNVLQYLNEAYRDT